MTNEPEQKNLEENISYYRGIAWFLIALGASFAVFGCLALAWSCCPCLDAVGAERQFLTKLNEFGCYLSGAVGSLWALAGLMLIYVAFLGQRLQILKQDKALAVQQANFALQQESISLQQFENGFFQLLNLQNEIANKNHSKVDLSAYSGEQQIKFQIEEGRHLFEHLYFELKGKIELQENQSRLIRLLYPQHSKEINLNIKLGYVKDIYSNQFYYEYQGYLGHYFRNLYHVFKFVDTCAALRDKDDTSEKGDGKESIKNKRRYTSIVRVQLSQYELALLFYNGISCYGEKKFKPLIERYGLLENFDTGSLSDQEHEDFYAASALHESDK